MEAFRDPLVQITVWFVYAALVWLREPQDRILLAAPVGGLYLVGMRALGDGLTALPGSPFLTSALLYVGIALVLLPHLIYVDRRARRWLEATLDRRGKVGAYVLAGASGLVAFVASLLAMYWTSEVQPELRGQYDLALVGGLLASAVAVLRVDRKLYPRARDHA